MTGLAATLVLLTVIGLGIGVISWVIARWQEADAPRDRPSWLGPDPARIEDAVRRLLRERRGGELPPESPEVTELARVHAFAMAMRNFDGEFDPEGQGLVHRRDRLAPRLNGAVRQWQTLQIADPTRDADGIAATLIENDRALEAVVAAAEWTELGVGVAVEDGRCGACVVVAAREPEDSDASN